MSRERTACQSIVLAQALNPPEDIAEDHENDQYVGIFAGVIQNVFPETLVFEAVPFAGCILGQQVDSEEDWKKENTSQTTHII